MLAVARTRCARGKGTAVRRPDRETAGRALPPADDGDCDVEYRHSTWQTVNRGDERGMVLGAGHVG